MIKGRWQAIVFIFLILLLAIGLSTVALNERSEEQATQTHTMAIALVNEDTGTAFNESNINFGDEFARQMNKDQAHDWYIVSRGVAESGFERNAYDMMIVIPNNFSDNALSIDEDAPEQVSLEYKINTTGHDDVRAEAEKAAGEILTNFNKQLIDVFFVSIIGNLQEAQDHVVDIIQKEKEYTDEYTANVYNPLDNFTGQFQRVQQSADRSKDNYEQLDDVLHNFESSLVDKVETSAEYDEDIATVLTQKEESSVATSIFAEQFEQLYHQMTHEDVYNQMERLELLNAYLYNELRERSADEEFNRERTLQSRITSLHGQIDLVKGRTDDFNEYVLEQLSGRLDKIITDGIDESFDNSMDDMQINDLIEQMDESIIEKINVYIEEIPSQINEINSIGLSEETLNTLQNVRSVSDRFTELDDFYEQADGEGPSYEFVEDLLVELRDRLVEGMTVTDSITLDEFDSEEDFYLTVEHPHFTIHSVRINGESVNFNGESIQLDISEEEPEVNISVRMSLKESAIDKIDLFQPLEWDWKLQQTTEEVVEDEQREPGEPEDPEEPENPEEPEEPNAPEDPDAPDVPGDPDDPDTPEDDSADEPNDESEDVVEEPEEEENDSEQPDTPETIIVQTKETTITHSHWNQKVHSLLYDVLYEDVEHPNYQFTADLIERSIAMMEGVHSLHTLYELYFGLDMAQANEDLEELLADDSLTKAASEDSLYYLIHEKQIKEIIKERISTDIANAITEEMAMPLEVFQTNVREYDDYVSFVQDHANELAQALEEASVEAENLNTNVGLVLTEVAAWRDNSNELLTEQIDVLNKDSEVQMALMQLDSGFKPILSQSESLADQARANFESTEYVYETLDAIDTQAGEIEQSGTTLVTQAEELAIKFSEKASEDLDFADNFNQVLSNSRIGDRQNDDLYSFLSNPVQTRNTGIIQETESFIAYFLVFIMAIVSFFTAYVLSNTENKGAPVTDFETDQTFIQKNMRPMLMTGSIGIIEGLFIGIISFILLDLPQTSAFSWVALITVMMIGLVLIATYALRQLKMVGMFILLAVFSLYLLLTNSLGFQFGNNEAINVARKVSPLQQLENWVTSFIEGTMSASAQTITFIILIVVAIIGLALNMLIVNRTPKEEGLRDEQTSEAN